ncbi:MAG TPA: DUF5615 family PIN-like protein [Thermoanaerobaculia bacterium]|nr:DUF5615 family PIN-like protein [Thermoanaerobaculia bacterium]
MKLLLDHNLSHKLVSRLADVYPESSQTRLLGFGRTSDSELWFYARTHGYLFVTKDRDVAELAILRGAPPKVVWFRTGKLQRDIRRTHVAPESRDHRPLRRRSGECGSRARGVTTPRSSSALAPPSPSPPHPSEHPTARAWSPRPRSAALSTTVTTDSTSKSPEMRRRSCPFV